MTAWAPAPPVETARLIEVRGAIQGIGFGPFVGRQAERFALTGWVRDRDGVFEILVQGSAASLDPFCMALSTDAPPLARVEEVDWRPVPPDRSLEGFQVDDGPGTAEDERSVPPDLAPCPACLADLFDPRDRRYRYPFINCAACGPRFTIIESLPYERARTSMRAFPMCAACRTDHDDPGSRFFGAEPITCPECGPMVTLLDHRWRSIAGDPIAAAAELVAAGAIVAIKGLGGFHLACDATDDHAVARLRRRQHRPDEPFAVMVADLGVARRSFVLSAAEELAMASPQAPIVLVGARDGLATRVAFGHRRLGAMLPSSPLHHLLLHDAGRPLVMTGGHPSGEPTCISDDDARVRLAGIADAFLVHDRDIVMRLDDSVTSVRGDTTVVLRRARSFAPAPIALPAAVEPILGCGTDSKGSFCLAHGDRAFLSQHLGTIDSELAEQGFAHHVERYRHLFAIEPQVVAHDARPTLRTSRFARALGLPTLAIEHHHAHVVSVMAEHHLREPVIGIAFERSGRDEDEALRGGGGFLLCDWASSQRIGQLRPVALPWSADGLPDPVGMAEAYAADAGCLEAALRVLHGKRGAARPPQGRIAAHGDVPSTGSAGSLFDAVAALTGVCRSASYPGQPAMALEDAAEGSATHEYGFDIDTQDGILMIDTRPTIAAVVKDLAQGRTAGQVAGRFHRTMAAATVAMCRLIAMQTDRRQVCLAGGLFADDLLASDLAARLGSVGFEVFVPRDVPVGDGGLALGQVLVAHARISAGLTEEVA